MAVIKCKMCGGDIVLNEEKTFGTCEYCGSVMTLPKVSDEQRAALFNRGNHFRRSGEFDKALAIYENIVREDDADAEAHWCCALCRFGIEYVEDPNTFEYIPTCHRASFDSFLEDVDYLAALENSDGITKRQYQKDAAKIAEVQKGILATSQNEEPFDVFICYKETDDSTKERTKDSLDAQEIYYQLTNAGYRVFFSRITLEDKAGSEYEPYIFAALNSAKVMIAIGSKPEYFNAVWVKNEWSRFLALMRKDRSKLLLPCYKNMDPYDLPEQLSVLQSYDMSKIGFIQDLIRGVKKVVGKDEPVDYKKAVEMQNTPSVNSLMERAKIALQAHDWSGAIECCNKVLDIAPKNSEAYELSMLANANCSTRSDYEKRFVEGLIREEKYYYLAKNVSSGEFAEWIDGLISLRSKRSAEKSYELGKELMSNAKSSEDFIKASELFKSESVRKYFQTDELICKCLEKAEETRKNEIYGRAKAELMKKTEEGYREAAKLFSTISGWGDADEMKQRCESRAVAVHNANLRNRAVSLVEADTPQSLAEAIEILRSVPNTSELITSCKKRIDFLEKTAVYNRALSLMNEGATNDQYSSREKYYRMAADAFNSISGWENSEELAIQCNANAHRCAENEENYRKVGELINKGKSGDIDSAIVILSHLGDWRNSRKLFEKLKNRRKKEKSSKAYSVLKTLNVVSWVTFVAFTVFAFITGFIAKKNSATNSFVILDIIYLIIIGALIFTVRATGNDWKVPFLLTFLAFGTFLIAISSDFVGGGLVFAVVFVSIYFLEVAILQAIGKKVFKKIVQNVVPD